MMCDHCDVCIEPDVRKCGLRKCGHSKTDDDDHDVYDGCAVFDGCDPD